MKKIFVSIFIITTILTPLFFVSKIQKVEAVTPKIDSINKVTEVKHANNTWEWNLNIQTTDIPDGTDVWVNLYKGRTPGENLIKAIVAPDIKDNISRFGTDSILEDNTDYTIQASVLSLPRTSIVFRGKTIEGDKGDVVYINPEENNVDTGIYTLLAPIGDLKVAPGNVGDYFNIIFKIAIGLCGALAVIMIVLGGIQYMGNESIFGQTEAKSKITAAILGLLIALGAYALLNTINPDLLGGGGVHIDQVSAEIQEEPILSDINTPIPSGSSNSFPFCKGGVRKTAVKTTAGYMTFCSAYSSKLQEMISSAYHATPSIALGGGAFRDPATQIAARRRNCADVYNTPSEKCVPPTAKPGTSAHENGLAVDFTCDGTTINWQTNTKAPDYQPKYARVQNTKKCFDWLTANASKYGFKNYTRENWHWSTGDLAGH
ncbi:MAG: D-alanyl-D-alanine carboxypeptidase family protein [Candidatus Paceibacterota bacterium]